MFLISEKDDVIVARKIFMSNSKSPIKIEKNTVMYVKHVWEGYIIVNDGNWMKNQWIVNQNYDKIEHYAYIPEEGHKIKAKETFMSNSMPSREIRKGVEMTVTQIDGLGDIAVNDGKVLNMFFIGVFFFSPFLRKKKVELYSKENFTKL